ncbi:MAG: YgjV family protein, partial [Erysipelotrichaceae bacterium]|nr:YgjV family protein [Erysipelotrichaceae bacterium]
MELLIQGFGIIGIISGVGAYQSNHHKRILTLRIINELCFAIQYVLLGSIAACIVNLVVCVRNVAFRSYIQKGKCTKGLIILFTLLFILITAMNWPGPSGFII